MSLILILRWDFLGFIRQIFVKFEVQAWLIMFFNSLCQNFHFEVRVPGCYLVNLCQISSLSMADHVFYSFCCYFWFWGGSTWVYQVNLSQIWSLSMADHVFNSFCCYIWFWGGSTWVVVGKSFSIFKFKHSWSCFLTILFVIFDFEVGVPGFY